MNAKSGGVPLFKKRASNKSIFNNNYYSNGTGNGNGQISNEASLIHQLVINKCVIQISEYFKSYASGHFQDVVNSLDEAVYVNISVALNNLIANKKYIDYEFIRSTLVNSLNALWQNVYQYTELKTLKSELAAAEKRIGILDDLVKLEEYINNLKNRTLVTIIPEVDVNVPLLTIKEPYNTYIKVYGLPSGGAFDPDKLAQISRAQNASHSDPMC
jgi:hypothetical protein